MTWTPRSGEPPCSPPAGSEQPPHGNASSNASTTAALTGSATSALISGGAAPLSQLTESFHPGVSPRRLQRIARVLGRRRDAEAAEVLFYRIDFPNEIVRHEVLESLAACAFQAGSSRRAMIDDRLKREAEDAAAKLAAVRARGRHGTSNCSAAPWRASWLAVRIGCCCCSRSSMTTKRWSVSRRTAPTSHGRSAPTRSRCST